MANWDSQMVDNNQLTTISELTPHTIYTIRVQAVTNVGPGPLSAPVHVKTQQGGRPETFNLNENGVDNDSQELIIVLSQCFKFVSIALQLFQQN
jgi:receptor-type tyrosine-protein phosphatase F